MSGIPDYAAAREKKLPHEVPAILWEVVGADVFMVNNETLLFIVDYYSKFPVVKKVESMLVEDLTWVTKVIFAKFSLPEKFVSAWAQIWFENGLRNFTGAKV